MNSTCTWSWSYAPEVLIPNKLALQPHRRDMLALGCHLLPSSVREQRVDAAISLVQILRGINYMHKHGICHRDLKVRWESCATMGNYSKMRAQSAPTQSNLCIDCKTKIVKLILACLVLVGEVLIACKPSRTA
eukprot:1247379-Amphidinium_carterae.1